VRNTQVEQQWLEFYEQGAYVFPLPAGGKNPGDLGIKWKDGWIAKGRNPWPQLASAQFDAEGLWLATGQISKRVVLDIDKPEAGDYWREKIGSDIFDAALRVTTGKGYHLHFRIPDEDDREWASHSDNEIGYDLRADGGGVVVPPSVHLSGRVYEWAGGSLIDVPEALRHPARSSESNVKSLDRAREKRTPGSTLTGLLSDPPREGGRNNWLTKVGGHLAKLWPGPMEDAYLELMQYIGQNLLDPMDEGEIAKTAESVWEREKSHATDLPHEAESGWLAGRDGKLYTRRKGEDGNIYAVEWADFDLRARRVVQEKEERVFYIDVETSHTTYLNEPLRADTLGNINRLNVWLAAHHIGIVGHPQDLCKVAYGTRIIRYLLAQNPEVGQIAEHYGHQDDGTFLTPEGLIEAGGVVPHRTRVPAAHLSGWVNYHYGTCPRDEAVEVLREVLTFQDETVASVFGSWWAMAILKGRYQSSLFPFMMLEAGSESGKTTGFFSMMVALMGSKDGAGQQTVASFRDAVGSHRNGIAWLDDMTEISGGQVIDIIRQATSEGTRGKKGGDNRSTERLTLLSPILVSGEGSGTMMSEKAMADRSIQLRFGSPKGRRSLRDPDRPQWDDILSLQARYGGTTAGLTGVSGTLVGQILARAPMLDSLGALRPDAGRVADKWAILRMGARILDDLLGGQDHADRVDRWVSEQVDNGAANLAINEIIPWALRNAGGGIAESPLGWQPAYYNPRTRTVWVSVPRLADRWLDRNHITARERQLGSEDAIRTELKAVGADTVGKVREVDRADGRAVGRRYVEIPAEWTARLLAAAGAEVPQE
jgi:hypothetical protein